jgi:ketosteroid isomerase-like protein
MNKTIVQNIYAAFKNKDIQSILDLQSDNAEWLVSASPDKIPWAVPGRGPKGVANFFKTLSELLATDAFFINDYIESDNKVVAIGYQAGYVKATGDHYEYDFVHVWELENGKVVEFRSYFDTAYVASALAGEPKTAV